MAQRPKHVGHTCLGDQVTSRVVDADTQSASLILRVRYNRPETRRVTLYESLPHLRLEAVTNPRRAPFEFLTKNVFVFKNFEVGRGERHDGYACNQSKDQSQAKRMHSASPQKTLSGTLDLDAE